MFVIFAFMLAAQPITETVTLEGSLVWGRDDLHADALAYRQSRGQVPVYVGVGECVSVVGGCGWIGDQVDLFLDGEFTARLWVCDCAAEGDLAWNRKRGRVAEVPWSTARLWWDPAVGPLDGAQVTRYSTHRPVIPR